MLLVFWPGVDLCTAHAIDPEQFVEMLFAFTVNNSHEMNITESAMDDFERKELTNHKGSARHRTKNGASKPQPHVNAFYDEIGSDDENDDVMDAYICTTPKVCVARHCR